MGYHINNFFVLFYQYSTVTCVISNLLLYAEKLKVYYYSTLIDRKTYSRHDKQYYAHILIECEQKIQVGIITRYC